MISVEKMSIKSAKHSGDRQIEFVMTVEARRIKNNYKRVLAYNYFNLSLINQTRLPC